MVQIDTRTPRDMPHTVFALQDRQERVLEIHHKRTMGKKMSYAHRCWFRMWETIGNQIFRK